MRLNRKLLSVAIFAIPVLVASEARDNRWNDAEARYRAKYGRSYPATERNEVQAKRDAGKKDQQAAEKKAPEREQERSRTSRNGA